MPASESAASLLMKAATPDLYRRNGFRITGLPVTASVREVAKQADKLKMLAELGGQASQQLAVIPGMPVPTSDEIREAMQRLKNVEARALDEFFWFWPESWEKPEADEAFVALKRNDLDAAFSVWADRELDEDGFIAAHNVAIVLHMRAIEWALLDFTHALPPDRVTKVHEYWKEAFDRWEWLVDDDRLWDAFKGRIRQIDDAALSTGFARRLRSELPQAFDKINAELALTYAGIGKRSEAEWHVAFLKSTHVGKDDVTNTIDIALAPTRLRLERSIEIAQKSTRADKPLGITHASKLLDSAEPLLDVFGMFHEADSMERCDLFDEVAHAAFGCAVDGYNSAMESLNSAPPPKPYEPDPKKVTSETFVSVLNRAVSLATNLDLRQRIQSNIATAKGNLQFDAHIKPLLNTLAAIQKLEKAAPDQSLRRVKAEVIPAAEALVTSNAIDEDARAMLGNSIAVVLRGIAIVAHNDFHQPTVSLEALTLALKFARDAKLVAQIMQDSETLGRNMGFAPSSLPLVQARKTDHATALPKKEGCSWLVVGAIIVIVGGIIISDSAKSTSSAVDRNPSTTRIPAQSSSRPPRSPSSESRSPTVPYFGTSGTSAVSPPPAPATAPSLRRDDWYTWKNSQLQEISAKMLSFDGSNVILEKIDGTTYTYPFSNLSTDSQNLARKLDAIPVEQPLPQTGVFRAPSSSSYSTGPLTIRTRAGSGNFYVKLVNYATGTTKMVIFVRDGETASDISVPAGTYEIRYACGDTWFGERFLFGSGTSYNKADSSFTFGNGSGYTVELFKQLNGNLKTSPVNKNNF